jgi:hypothetical protein
VAGYTDNYNVILGFDVRGLGMLEAAAKALQNVDGELADVARRSAATASAGVAGARAGTVDPRQAEADLRRIFQGSTDAMKSFTTGVDTGSRRGRDAMSTLNR